MQKKMSFLEKQVEMNYKEWCESDFFEHAFEIAQMDGECLIQGGSKLNVFYEFRMNSIDSKKMYLIHKGILYSLKSMMEGQDYEGSAEHLLILEDREAFIEDYKKIINIMEKCAEESSVG